MRSVARLENYFGAEYLEQLFLETGSAGASGTDGVTYEAFRVRLPEHVRMISTAVLSGAYKFTRYRQVLLTKGPNRRPRVVSVPTVRDRLTLRASHRYLKNVIPYAGGRLVSDIIPEVEELRERFSCALRTDIRNFYPSIPIGTLVQRMSKHIPDDRMVSLLEGAVRTETGSRGRKRPRAKSVPQGLPISNSLANFYLADTDLRLRSRFGERYVRFVDDILVLCNPGEADEVKREVSAAMEAADLKISLSKTRSVRTTDFEYLGYAWVDGLLQVRKSSVQKLESALARICTAVKHGDRKQEVLFRMNLRITGCTYQGKVYGWVFFFRLTKDLSQLYRLDWLANRLAVRTGLDPVELRSFVRTYFSLKGGIGSSGYIPSLDKTVDEQRRFLTSVLGLHVSSWADEEVEDRYARYAYSAVRQLERDLRNLS